MRKISMMSRVAALVGVAALILAGCSDSGDDDGKQADEKSYTIGLSNGFVGSEWRTQMVDGMQEVVTEYQKDGVLEDLVVENADTDVNGQIQQIRNLINKGVDAIIINPNSVSALDAVFQEAADQDIKIFAVDQAVPSPNVTNVVIDQGEWAAISARWLAGELGDGSKIVVVNGVDGNPANEARWDAAKAVFDDAGVEILTIVDGGWDQATGQQVMSNLLATYPDIDGVWTQDGMAQGIQRAIDAAGKTDDILVSGEARVGFMRMWDEMLDDGYKSIGVYNPPGGAATAVHVAVAVLQGEEFKDDALDENTLFVPIPGTVDNDNFAEVWSEVSEKDDSYALDGQMTKDEVQSTFFK